MSGARRMRRHPITKCKHYKPDNFAVLHGRMTPNEVAKMDRDYRGWMAQRGRHVVEYHELNAQENDARKRVTLPNGLNVLSAWYEVSDRTANGKLRNYEAWLRESRRARKEVKWLNEEGRKRRVKEEA